MAKKRKCICVGVCGKECFSKVIKINVFFNIDSFPDIYLFLDIKLLPNEQARDNGDKVKLPMATRGKNFKRNHTHSLSV